jgi:ComF family protein
MQHNRGFDLCIHPCAFEGAARDMVHRLKYKDKRDAAITMAAMIKEIVIKNGLKIDLIVPVPIHKKRLKKRGYNQSQLIAEELSNILNISHANVLERVKDTPSQVLFNGDMRWYNVKDAFRCMADVSGKSILLVDDVITTGATMISCGEVLITSGAAFLTAAAFAMAG